ncbi:MAG: hypothetical protein MZV49_07240 [Rhodopseudomonas palustris]|nr:hypothetical protein [Rhodopseudomonas palustris]
METNAWYAPSMYNIVKQNGQRRAIWSSSLTSTASVNSGLGSIRGARMAENRTSRATRHPTAATDRSDGLALWIDAADDLG